MLSILNRQRPGVARPNVRKGPLGRHRGQIKGAEQREGTLRVQGATHVRTSLSCMIRVGLMVMAFLLKPASEKLRVPKKKIAKRRMKKIPQMENVADIPIISLAISYSTVTKRTDDAMTAKRFSVSVTHRQQVGEEFEHSNMSMPDCPRLQAF